MTQNDTPAIFRISIPGPGGYDRLRIEPIAVPVAGPGEVVIEVVAAGVNFADCFIRWGLYDSAKKYVGWPITPGFEVSGRVHSVGPTSPTSGAQLRPGDEVYAVTRFGGYSRYVKVPSHQVFRKPIHWSFEEAAGFPAVYVTAYHALFHHVVIRKGARILVHSAAGGVGHALLQLCRLSGFHAVGVVGRTDKVPVAIKYGAESVIDKSRDDLWTLAKALSPQGYDVILDANGPETQRASFNHLRETGKLIAYGFHNLATQGKSGRLNWFRLATEFFRIPRFSPLELTNTNKSIIGFNLSFLFERIDLLDEAFAALNTWIAEGKLLPPPVTVFPAAEVARAHELLESGRTTGKVVLRFE